jgi:hypothetical protein
MTLAAIVPVLAQCVMCFRTAAAQNGARAHVLDIGILLLGAPPFLILAGYCLLFYKKNAVTREEKNEPISSVAQENTFDL